MSKKKKSSYEKSALDKAIDKKMGYKEGSQEDKGMDAKMMLKMGMQGKGRKNKKKYA